MYVNCDLEYAGAASGPRMALRRQSILRDTDGRPYGLCQAQCFNCGNFAGLFPAVRATMACVPVE